MINKHEENTKNHLIFLKTAGIKFVKTIRYEMEPLNSFNYASLESDSRL